MNNVVEREELAVVGLGKLGLPLALLLASKGYAVTGVDAIAEVIESLSKGISPIREPGVDELLASTRDNFRVTASIDEAIANAAVSFVVVPTPSEASGAFSLDFVQAAMTAIGESLRDVDHPHTVVLVSTVMPGHMDSYVQPALERAAGKPCGGGLSLCYSPLFIALGSVLHDLRQPDMVLIGANDERAGDLVEGIYQVVCENEPAFVRTNFINAELTKIAVNTYVTTKMTFANMLGEICEQLPGADAYAVAEAIGNDSRIGFKYLRPATAYGGPCFPRDNRALAVAAADVGVRASLAECTDAGNQWQLERLQDMVLSYLPTGGTVAILGLTYKPGTHVTEEAPGLLLAQRLAARGVGVQVFDPVVGPTAGLFAGTTIEHADSLGACVATADVVVLATACPEFAQLSGAVLPSREPKQTVVDCWRLVDKAALGQTVQLVQLGVGQAEPAVSCLEQPDLAVSE